MPSRISRSPSSRSSKERTGIIKFTNCLLAKDGKLVPEDLWISSITGKVLQSQEVFYNNRASPDRIIDLGGRVLSPGFIDVQINGGFGFDFSVEQESITEYAKGVMKVNRGLVKTGVTSYLPTVTSQRAELYPKIIPYLGPSGARRDPNDGAESLGAHIEGPFISPTKNGIHSVSVLRTADNGFADMEACYGASNLQPHASPIKMLTLAPELPNALSNIHELTSRGIVTSIGHSEATYEQARDAISAGATMITHLFNAMRPLHHRNPGIFGTLGTATATAAATPSTPAVTPPGSPVPAVRFKKPYFGLISDGVHLHPTSIKIAWNAHRDGAILVTDAMRLLGLPDGTYDWTNGDRIIKKGLLLTLEGTDGKLAGTSVSLVECVSNFINWADATVGEALRTVTATPAKMLGLQGVKGSLEPGADADLVVLEEGLDTNGMKKLTVEEVWKFGKMVYSTDDVIEEEEE